MAPLFRVTTPVVNGTSSPAATHPGEHKKIMAARLSNANRNRFEQTTLHEKEKGKLTFFILNSDDLTFTIVQIYSGIVFRPPGRKMIPGIYHFGLNHSGYFIQSVGFAVKQLRAPIKSGWGY
jgi:hypothetical protein